MPAPVLLAPVGVQTIVHPDGELASARAAAALGLVFIHSTAAAHSIEQVAEASGDGSPLVPALLAQRPRRGGVAGRAGRGRRLSALVVTLDTFMMGWRPTDLDTAYLPFLQGIGIANYLTDPAFNAPLGRRRPGRRQGVRAGPASSATRRSRWDDLAWLREQTGAADRPEGHPAPRRRPCRARRRASTASSCPTTAAARSTGPSPPSTPCRRCSTPWAAPSPCCSTPACAPGPTSSRRWRWARPRSSTGGRTSTGWASAGRPGSSTCCAACSARWT